MIVEEVLYFLRFVVTCCWEQSAFEIKFRDDQDIYKERGEVFFPRLSYFFSHTSFQVLYSFYLDEIF